MLITVFWSGNVENTICQLQKEQSNRGKNLKQPIDGGNDSNPSNRMAYISRRCRNPGNLTNSCIEAIRRSMGRRRQWQFRALV
jgi:hypothetical protein